ncbi:hypothetical protein ACFDR9_001642 [Janthinobacterium sp. CG_23.3]|uniref:hypothetical protein n=1 Tax=Janthinobacterium sp. CG_23.3 TaxID=3349634 RepID=UPI0038D48261
MHQQRARLFKLSTISLALALAACGGGGSSNVTPDPVVSASRTVAGTAAKGIIKGGTVKVFAVNADGTLGTTALASGTTGADGTFSIKIAADLLTFVVEVSGNASATTADEATGEDLPIGEVFKLKSVVKLGGAGETPYSGSVSPLTDMVAKAAAGAAGGLSAANIASAKAGFTAFFGFDPETVKPVNSNSPGAATASAAEKLQSVMLAAISKMAKDGSLDCAKPTPADKLSCVVGKIGAIGAIGAGGLTVNDTLTGAIDAAAAEVVGDPAINKTGTTTVAQLPKGTVPIVAPAANPIAAATRLFNSLRSNIGALSKADKSGIIDLRADGMRADFDKATAPLDDDLAKWVQLTTRGIDFLRDYQAGHAATTNMPMYAGGKRIGGCGVYQDGNASVAATAAGNAVSVACSIVRKNVPGSFSSGGGHSTFKQVTAVFIINPVAGSSTAYTYSSRARIETLFDGVRDPAKDVPVGAYGNAQNRALGDIQYLKTGDIVNNITFSGMMPARTDAYGAALSDHGLWSIAASRTAEGNKLFKYALAGSITSIKDGQPAGKVSIADDSFLRTEEQVEGSIVTTGVKEFSLGLEAEAGGSKVAGKLVLSEAKADKSGFDYQPTKIAFTGKLSTSNAEFFTGALTFAQPNFNLYDSTQPASDGNVAMQSATLVGKLSIPDRPALIVQFSGTRSRGATEKLNLTGQYNDGTNLVNLGLSVVGGSSGGGDQSVLTISSVDGVALTLTGADTADVLKDGVKVAVLNTKTGLINFTDGSFFSLK